ncbi:UDP-N-acetylglucosamine 2-epimerase [Methanosarcina siciliae C2J]|uniref:UDP-N-acetylglucosamine 2-epimerase n=3 Tax=Methanosarcina siciliae TaxID=38027 RepID=A0A0E3P5N9_9EURY|nr:UDP-N-acetylglucosamine 2-epimerase [Methanosarcina siciliae T4/M]AKB36606.1 UDP-N-acetylglucosamine 2-epimerase [Methanosarcina siciliae C2J]
MRKILYISGTRADYGLIQSTLRNINSHPGMILEMIVTGMHLMEEFGTTINEIRKDGLKYHTIESTYKKDEKGSMVEFIGVFLQKLSLKIKEINPDIILVLGDRGEMLAGAIAGVYLGIPVAHIHGGEVSSTVDDLTRHAITKLAHIHFPATKLSAKRIIKMGEPEETVFVVGAPGLDSILSEKLMEPEKIADLYGLDLSRPTVVVIQHPVSMEIEHAKDQIRQTLDAVVDLKFQTVVVYPNADAGGREMIEVIKHYENNPNITVYKNIPRKEYLSLLKVANVLVGNSSSGIIEASSFRLPVVNIGTRQKGRERGENVIDANYEKNDIKSKILRCLYDEIFWQKVKNFNNPYGDGKAGDRITEVLDNISINEKLLQKSLSY